MLVWALLLGMVPFGSYLFAFVFDLCVRFVCGCGLGGLLG